MVLTSGSIAQAQRPKIETFTVGSGLPSAMIFGLGQDASGRLWILSRGGVTSYDGRAFRTHSGSDGLPAGQMSALTVDPEGRVWTATRLGTTVFYREDTTWNSLPDPPLNPRPFNGASCLTAGGLSPVTVGTTADGLYVWDGEAWTRFGVEDGLPSDYVTSMATGGGGTYVGTSAGLCRLAARGLDCRLGDDRRLRQRIVAVALSAVAETPGRLWILGDDWLGYLEPGHLEDLTLHVVHEGIEMKSYDSTTLGALAPDPAGGVYFGSPSRAFFLDPADGTVSAFGVREGLSGEGMSALLVDRESNVWIGGLRGLSKISSRRFLTLDREHGLLDDEVTALAEPEPGRYILGHNTGLTFLEDGNAEVFAFSPGPRPASSPPDEHRALDLAVEAGGQVRVAAHHLGLLRLEKDRTLARAALDNQGLAVEIDAQGKLWAITGRQLFVLDGTEFTPVDTGFDLHELLLLRWLYAADDGRLFVATRRGVLWHDKTAWHVARSASVAADNTYTVLVADDGTVWVGTIDGLYELRGQELLKVRHGPVIHRPIYLSLQDRRGRAWFGTDDGVFVWDGQELRHLTFRHGLAGRETNRGAGLVDHRGRVWIGTDQGVSIYQERYDLEPMAAPTVELAAIEAGGERHPPAAKIRLSHHQNSLAFHVETIFMSHERDVVWRYRLESFDDDWLGPTAISTAAIRYTNLPPGRYRFRIAAGWSGGPWGEEVSTAEIFIARPLWRRPGFYVLVAAGLALGVYGAHRFRVRTLHARARELEVLNVRLGDTLAERQRLIAELETKNAELERFTYTVSHDLKSPLVTITGFIGYLVGDAESGNLERLKRDVATIRTAAGSMARLLHELLELSRVGHTLNSFEDVSLTDVARQAGEHTSAALAEHGVRLEIAPDLPVVSGDRVRLVEVLQNLIENAVKFMGDPSQPRIEIGAQRDGGQAVFYVRDNGVGVPPRYHEKIFGLFERLDLTIEGTGVGLALVKRIIELHGGRIWVESEGERQGSTFFFTISS